MNATALDTSVLIDAERSGLPLEELLSAAHAPYYVPALAAAEFLAGVNLVESKATAEAARRYYDLNIRLLVDSFTESDASMLGWLNAENKRRGRTMKFYDAAIAASVLARQDGLLTLDNDFDRLADMLTIIRPSEHQSRQAGAGESVPGDEAAQR